MRETIRVGIAKANITPAPGGIFHEGDVLAEGVRDELYLKALVFDDGNERAAIVTGDLILFGEDTALQARRRIEELTGIEGEKVMLAASHTHSGPPTTRWLSEGVSEAYLRELADKIAGAVYAADSNKREALIAAGKGEVELSINRWIMTPDGAKWGPNPEGPKDDEVCVMRVDDAGGGIMALLVNYAAHASVMSWGKHHLFSGDYPSYLQSTIERIYDGRVVALFTNGASGDTKIAFLTEDGKDFLYGDWEDARRYGRMIAAEAVKVAETLKPKSIMGLSVASNVVELPLCEPPSIEDVERELRAIEGRMKELEQKGEKPDWGLKRRLIWARETLEALKKGDVTRSVPGEVQVMRLGDDIAFVAVPGELFVEVGLRMKSLCRNVGIGNPFVVAYANAYVGYLPSARSCREDGERPRYDWHKFIPYPSTFSEEVEDVLVGAVESLL